MSDSITEVTNETWFGRIGNSLKGIVFGLILLVIGVVLLFWNEGNWVNIYKKLQAGAAATESLKSADKVDSAFENKLVHLTSKATTDQTLTDPEFLVSDKAIRLNRNVQMYQWVEKTRTKSKKKVGGSKKTETETYYEKEWKAGWVDSSEFKLKEGHTNPKPLFQNRTEQADKVTFGAFTLPGSLVSKIKTSKPLPLDTKVIAAMPENIRSKASLGDKFLYFRNADREKKNTPAEKPKTDAPGKIPDAETPAKSDDSEEPAGSGDEEPPAEAPAKEEVTTLPDAPAEPEVGDVKVKFSVVLPVEVSIIAQQTGTSFRPFEIPSGEGSIEMLREGSHSAESMYAKAHAENTNMLWILRGVGFVLVSIGFYMMFQILSVIADFVPFIGSLVGCAAAGAAGILGTAVTCVVIAIAWLFYRPLIAVVLLLLAGGLLLLVVILFLKMRKPKQSTR